MASYIRVRRKVYDFSAWKPAYDALLPQRVEAGLAEAHLLRSADDPSEVVILFRVADPDCAKALAGSAWLRETMQKVGVLDRPDNAVVNN